MRRTRRWFRLGNVNSNLIYIDFELKHPIAFIEMSSADSQAPLWAPNQDEVLYRFIAQAGDQIKHFNFNPHNLRDANQILLDAIAWCEDMVGPPVTYEPIWKLMLYCLAFWKFKPVFEGWRLVAIVPRNVKVKPEPSEIVDEWESIRRQLERPDENQNNEDKK